MLIPRPGVGYWAKLEHGRAPTRPPLPPAVGETPEVVLVLTPKGFFLVEIKSAPGIVEGDQGTWSWHHEGRIRTVDNPLVLANRKADV